MIEILETYMKLSSNKQSSLLEFLSNDTIHKLKNYNLVENIYLNDNIILIKKNTLTIDHIGKIYKIKNEIISIKKSNSVNINLNKNNYYIFVKRIKNKNNDRIFYETLLKQLN